MNVRDNDASVVVFIQRPDGKVLGVARKYNPSDFGLPGGKVEPGESLEQAALREVTEETSLHIKRMHRGYSGPCGRFQVVAFIATEWEGEPVSQEGEGDVAWVDLITILEGAFGGFHARLFKALGYRIRIDVKTSVADAHP